jgi:hypothetical protein
VLTVRVLFGCAGWPSGVLEIASWAEHEGLAKTAIVALKPGLALRPEFIAAIRRFAERQADPARLVQPDGSLTRDIRDALVAVGGPFLQKLIDFRPHVVGRRVESGQMEEVKQFVRAVRLFSEAEIVLGGPTATSHPIDVLAESGADYLFAGEAEEPFNQFLALARQHNSRDRLAEIPGLAYWHGGRVRHNTLPGDGYERTALDEPHVGPHVGRSLRDRHSRLGETRPRDCLRDAVRPVARQEVIAGTRLDWSLLEGFTQVFESLYFTGGRGCPGACTFCAKLHGPEVRAKSAEQLMEEIEAADAKVADGSLRVAQWELFQHLDDPAIKHRRVAWAAIYDEDFFLDRRRAVEFFRLWNDSPLRERYRINVQTNPCSLLDSRGGPHAELFRWIDRIKPMIQLGAESLHSGLLRRWHKRHTVEQLRTVLDALDATRQDYGVFILLSDFDSTPEEVVDAVRLLAVEAFRRRRMRIASSPFTIPLFDSDTRKRLEYGGLLGGDRVRHFTDYETPQPTWLDPLAADLADVADSELRFAINLPERDGALVAACEAVLGRIAREETSVLADPRAGAARRARIGQLRREAEWAVDEIKELRFQGIDAPRRGG